MRTESFAIATTWLGASPAWYFWATILAIAASGAAITAFAVKAARDERPDALDASAGRTRLMGPPDQGFGLRF